jgi:type I restriction enzyme M protein
VEPRCSCPSRLGSFDCVVANPPFGANIVIDDEEILEQYDLAAMWDRGTNGTWSIRIGKDGKPVLQKNQPPEILFIERCVQLLTPGVGRFALVIPNGILNNPALGYVRTWLMQNVQMLAIVDMARELFQPKNDTQTSMVLARRLDETERAAAVRGELEYAIFMATTERVGHDKRGNILYRRTDTGEDVLVTKSETVAEIDAGTGEEVLRAVEIQDRQIDDDLPDVAVAYLRWLGEQT